MGKVLPVLLVICLGLAEAVGAQTNEANLFFSEYVEGSSNNKALEIFNPTGGSVDMGGLLIEKYVNGSSVAANISTSSGALLSGGVFVLCNTNAVQAIKDVCNFQTGALNFNGNDALVLKNQNGNILDVIGQTGFDPGTAWGNSGVTTMDHTLIRKCEINRGDLILNDTFDPITEWNGYPVDTYSDLGSHITCYPTPTPLPTPTETPVTPTPTIAPSPTPTQEHQRPIWKCETKTIKFWWWKKWIEIPWRVCRFSLLH